jgi:hypothetical protein
MNENNLFRSEDEIRCSRYKFSKNEEKEEGRIKVEENC